MNLSDLVERTHRTDFPLPDLAVPLRRLINEFVRVEDIPIDTQVCRSFAYRLRDIWIWKMHPSIEPNARLKEHDISVFYEIDGGRKGQPLRRAVSLDPETLAGKTLLWFEELINEISEEDSPVIKDGEVRFSPWYYLATMPGQEEIFFPISIQRNTK